MHEVKKALYIKGYIIEIKFEDGKKKRIDLRGKKERNWNPFFKNLAQIERRNPPQ